MTKQWFKQRSYGWGWTPITIEGWLSLIVFVVGSIYFVKKNNIPLVFILVACLIILGYLKGPKPKWNWGKK